MEKLVIFFQRLFYLSNAESKGFVKLLAVCLLAIAVMYLPNYFFQGDMQATAEDTRVLDSLVSVLENKGKLHQIEARFSFDPNILSVDSFVLLGFKKEIAQRIVNYRNKGGQFHVRRDLTKIFGLSDQEYEKVYDYIDLPDSLHSSTQSIFRNLNEITAFEMQSIPMIGQVLAARIVKYRELLGGFVSKDQLNEVYGLSEEAAEILQNSVFINPNFRPRLIRVNHDSLKILKKHPYISEVLAEDIVRYRDINSIIESEKVLANFKSLDKSSFEKLILYLDFR